ncbi:MAG: hypothetical protein ACRDWY_12095 [Actinomycetes bacterium]
MREIEKCDVRCSNCHARKTACEDNSWRQRVFEVDQRLGSDDRDDLAHTA